MQISRTLLLTCAVAACLIPTLVHAADNEAQIRARQALEEKMKQIETQPPPAAVPTNPAPVMVKPKAAAKPQATKPAPPVVTVTPNSTSVESQPAPSSPINISTPSNDAATRQKLEDALKQVESAPKPAVPEPMQPATPVAPNHVTVQTPPPAPVTPNNMTVQSEPAPSAPAYISTPSNDEATNQKLQEALRQKMQQLPPEPNAPVVATQKPAPAKATKPAPASTATYAPEPAPAQAPVAAQAPTSNYAPLPTANTTHPTLPEMPTPAPAPVAKGNQPGAPTINLPPLPGPATGLSPAKQQKLDELLNQYRADQITPQQYHEQRAKILAEP